MKKLILIELNEINFDIVEKYILVDSERFPALKKLLSYARIITASEKQYELLEPWIQWASVHTGKTYARHGVYRLGDIVGSGVPQIFEQIENFGYKVGVISAMNAENRLVHPAYFLPDPWTQTPSDSSWWSRSLTQAMVQAVNDNARSRITIKSALQVLLCVLRFARPIHYRKYLSLVMDRQRKPWLKALVLDLLLHDLHWRLFDSKQPNFSTLFLNAGAHIQHHYFYNAGPVRNDSPNKNPAWYVSENDDPLADVLVLYDLIVGEYFSRSDTEVVLATGLTQKPYDHITFYYRLNNHSDFLRKLGIEFSSVFPRMTRDFLVEFEDENKAQIAEAVLGALRVDGGDTQLFGEIDNRGKSLFVTLTYPREINASTYFRAGSLDFTLLPEVSFVAIKNGMHHEEGFAFFTPGFTAFAPANNSHVSALGISIINFFGVTGVQPVVSRAVESN